MKNKITILLCDDDKYFRMAVKEVLAEHGLVYEAESEVEAEELLNKQHFDLALIDMDIDGPKSGINLLKETKFKNIHSIILSSQKDDAIIEEAYNSGCDHFLAKSQYRTYLEPYIHSFKRSHFTQDFAKFFKEKYITQDPELIEKITDLSKVNLKNKTVFITGETGVGKTLIGELLHHQNYAKDKPFIHLNCAEISENLIESELFGHEKGSFTGANSKKIGKLELANGGTLFLDEIGTMPMPMQQKLLKALDQNTFYPVGSDQPVHSQFTLITATCEDLFDKIAKEQFRKDLFFRVSGLNLDIKPLRERHDDIPLLIKHFLQSSHRRVILKEEAIAKLKTYDWPGNIRELRKKIELLTTNGNGIILAKDINFNFPGAEVQSNLTSNQKDFIKEKGLREFIKMIEEESIKMTLKQNRGKISKSIKELKISSSAFYRIYENINLNL